MTAILPAPHSLFRIDGKDGFEFDVDHPCPANIDTVMETTDCYLSYKDGEKAVRYLGDVNHCDRQC